MPTPAEKGRPYDRVKAILSDALDQPVEERRAWVARAVGDDQALHTEVRELLDEVDQLDGFLERGPRLPDEGFEIPDDAPPSILPEMIGDLRVVRLLGFGSMGVVYLAEQQRPTRRVAVKVLRASCVETDGALRFQREIQALGRLQHRGIAQIYATGVEKAGAGDQRWFSMEYVDGVGLREHCRREKLSLLQRIALVIHVIDVVQYAHDQGVLHRDLKPDNILIGRDGLPKVLDFGVARLQLDDDLPSLRTMTGAVVGTIAYMSPEQARGAHIDEKSDVFSLGAILYELLSDRLPYESRGRSLHQLVRSLAEDEPTPISTHGAELTGDLEAVIHTAIDSDPRRRYASVRHFGDDLQRLLQSRPVHARPPTAFDQLRKLVVRNRRLATVVGLSFAVLSIALVVSLAGLRRASAAEQLAEEHWNEVVRLAHQMRFDELEARADELWPVGPQLRVLSPGRDYSAAQAPPGPSE